MKEKVSSKSWKWSFCTIASKLRMSTEFFILLYCFMFTVNRKLLEFIIFYLLILKNNIFLYKRRSPHSNQNKLLKHQLYSKVFIQYTPHHWAQAPSTSHLWDLIVLFERRRILGWNRFYIMVYDEKHSYLELTQRLWPIVVFV